MNPQFLAGSSNKGGASRSRVSVCTSRNARAAPALLWSRCTFKVENTPRSFPAPAVTNVGVDPWADSAPQKGRGKLAAAQVPKQLSSATSRRCVDLQLVPSQGATRTPWEPQRVPLAWANRGQSHLQHSGPSRAPHLLSNTSNTGIMRHSSPQLWPFPHGPGPTSRGLFSKCYFFLLYFQS